MTTLLDCIQLETGPNPTASVIWLHGLGADGNDFVPLVPELDLRGYGSIRFIFPNAPSMPVTINNGYVMPAWYDILGIDLVRREDEAGIRRSATQIVALIEHELARGIKASRIALAGFSQGCAMTLFTGLRYSQTLAGLIGLSGYLPVLEKTAAEVHAANAKTPIFLAHGSMDPVVPLARAEASRDHLIGLGYSVQWHCFPMQHSVHPQEVREISSFLRAIFAPQ